MKENIKPATGRLGVLVVGVGGAVATTMITGTLAARKGLAKAIGSIAQMATMRMQDGKEHLIKDIVPLVDLNDIVFGGWDIFADDAYEAAKDVPACFAGCADGFRGQNPPTSAASGPRYDCIGRTAGHRYTSARTGPPRRQPAW